MGQSAPTFVASDRPFTIDLSDAIFNQIEGQRLTGPPIDAGEEGAAVVRATITQTASSTPPTPVPDTGSTAALLGLGLLAMALARKSLPPTGQVPLHQLASGRNLQIPQINTDSLCRPGSAGRAWGCISARCSVVSVSSVVRKPRTDQPSDPAGSG